MKLTFIFNLLIAVAAVTIGWHVGEISSPTPPAGGTAADRKSGSDEMNKSGSAHAASPIPLIHGQMRGMAIQLHGGDDVYERYHRLIPELAALGADTVLFVVHGWQTHAGTLDLHLSPQRTAAAEPLGKLLDLAALHGMRRILMPVVLLKNPRNGEWRGKIIPPGHDWDAWFKRYQQFMDHWAKIAERHHVEVLMVGSELIKSEAYTKRWQETIAKIRGAYHGKLGYSSNWDHYQTNKIGFWGDLDYVGMTTYYELARAANPGIEEIDENWARIKRDILTFQREINKPIIFTEVGWCSQEGAAKEGWNYYAKQEATEAGRREQAMLYESFMRTWSDEPGVGGIIWWEWDLSPGGNGDFNYTPRGKLAETLLKMWFSNGRQKSPRVNADGVALPTTQKSD